MTRSTIDCLPIDAGALDLLGDTVCVWAHPDDETYLCGGVMAALRAAGRRVVCVTATRGEGGGQLPPSELGELRTRELDEALRVLGVDEHLWLDLPDGGCDAVPPEGPIGRIAAVLRAVRPATVLTFAPDGLTGHPDHRAVGRWTRQAFAAVQVPGSHLLETAITASARAWFAPFEAELSVTVGEPAQPTEVHDLAVHAALPAPLLERKLEALDRQASQTAPLRAAMGDDAFRVWVGTEMFRPAMP
jgi:LmbE family N-acetylglucosaminyl deacetylase